MPDIILCTSLVLPSLISIRRGRHFHSLHVTKEEKETKEWLPKDSNNGAELEVGSLT